MIKWHQSTIDRHLWPLVQYGSEVEFQEFHLPLVPETSRNCARKPRNLHTFVILKRKTQQCFPLHVCTCATLRNRSVQPPVRYSTRNCASTFVHFYARSPWTTTHRLGITTYSAWRNVWIQSLICCVWILIVMKEKISAWWGPMRLKSQHRRLSLLTTVNLAVFQTRLLWLTSVDWFFNWQLLLSGQRWAQQIAVVPNTKVKNWIWFLRKIEEKSTRKIRRRLNCNEFRLLSLLDYLFSFPNPIK